MVKTLKKILIEMIPIILGILVALFINNWKENKENERFLTHVLDSIEKEVKEDRDALIDVLPKQYALIDTINLYIDDENVSIIDCIIKINGLKVFTSKNTSWWSFLNSKIEIVGYETISALSGLEEGKQFLNLKISKLMDFAFDKAESTGFTPKKMLIIQILNVIDSEEELLKLCKEYLNKEVENKQIEWQKN